MTSCDFNRRAAVHTSNLSNALTCLQPLHQDIRKRLFSRVNGILPLRIFVCLLLIAPRCLLNIPNWFVAVSDTFDRACPPIIQDASATCTRLVLGTTCCQMAASWCDCYKVHA